jgi:S-formylglutathione hydrolase FrmB
MGGFGSIHMAIRHPGRFASVTPISAPVFDTEQMLEFIGDRMVNIFIPTHRIFGPPRPVERVRGHDPFVQLQKPADLHGSSLVLAWGKRDRPGLEDTNRKFIRHLQEHDIPHESWVYDGGHNWKSWTPVIGRALRLQLTSDAPDASAHAAHGN